MQGPWPPAVLSLQACPVAHSVVIRSEQLWTDGPFQTKTEEEEIDRTPWGELEPSDEESSEEEEEEESDEDKPDETGFITPADRCAAALALGAAAVHGLVSTLALFFSPQWSHHSRRLLVSAGGNGDS